MTSPPITDREYAYFKITDQGEHSIISEKLGIKPTNEWSEGDISPRTKRPYKFMSWNLESGFDDTHQIDEHIQKLLSILEPLEKTLNGLRNVHEIS